MDSLRMLTWTDLIKRLKKAHTIRDGKGNTSHLYDNAIETILCMESELVRRGMDIPPDERARETPKKKQARKKK